MKGKSTYPSNYRPIATISLFSKITVSIINRLTLGRLQKQPLINDRQYGFRSGRSVGDFLTLLTLRWAEATEGAAQWYVPKKNLKPGLSIVRFKLLSYERVRTTSIEYTLDRAIKRKSSREWAPEIPRSELKLGFKIGIKNATWNNTVITSDDGTESKTRTRIMNRSGVESRIKSGITGETGREQQER
ncbi:hypothetical protein EVAR_57965_1 [Eumeta japonica]|uniref:Reverse transcriptase domain-containing protein n=1 Tax=Eumeta variegata TaxID=151549 RepID=A0A4C1XVN4_EUMVA|nr:hypothetical protein EVAR_57965_1 [Eumeta japonica]